MNFTRAIAVSAILVTLFLVGALLMGFEMLGTRYLNPYFGSGINTWACLISVVLMAMMAGYMAGGYIVDRMPRADLLAFSSILSGLSMLVVPVTADPMLLAVLEWFGDGFWSILISSIILSFVPVLLLSACSPFAVRLLLDDLSVSGRITGLVYSISTLGNVVGTLATTYFLIPNFGVRAITTAFGIALVLIGVVFWLMRNRISSRLQLGTVALALVVVGLPTITETNARQRAAPKRLSASYPEGPLWIGTDLLFTEMGRNRVMRLSGRRLTTFWSEIGCGPTAIARHGTENFAVLCHVSRKVVIVSPKGRRVAQVTNTMTQGPFNNPNDTITDGNGGIFFSDPGLFSIHAPARGYVYHLSDKQVLTRLAGPLRYPNGLAYDAKRRLLYVSEHLRKRVLVMALSEAGSVTSIRIALDVAPMLKAWSVHYPEAGPDGIELDGGRAIVAIYGAARLVIFGNEIPAKVVRVAMPYVTNVAAAPGKIAVVGAFNNRSPPYEGRVQLWSRAKFFERAQDYVEGSLRR